MCYYQVFNIFSEFDMRTEIGHIAIDCDLGRFEFIPSFKNMRKICDPNDMPSFFAGLMGHDVNQVITTGKGLLKFAINRVYDDAVLVMQCCCDDDISALTGRVGYRRWRAGGLPQENLLIIARSLLVDGVVGRPKPNTQSSKGRPVDTIDVYDYVDLAVSHLKISQDDAERLTKTDFDRKWAAKFPDAKPRATLEDHKHNLNVLAEINARRAAKQKEANK